MTVYRPADAAEAAEVIAAAAAERQPLELLAGGTKRGLGRPMRTSHSLDASRLSGVIDYDPPELQLTVGSDRAQLIPELELDESRDILVPRGHGMTPLPGSAPSASMRKPTGVSSS